MIKTKRELNFIDLATLLCACACVAWLLSGCSTTTGWRVEFGAHPINAVHDTRDLHYTKGEQTNEFTTKASR